MAEERLAKLSGVEQIRREKEQIRQEKEQLRQEKEQLRQDRQRLMDQPGLRQIQENQKLLNWLQQLDNGIEALLESRRWKIGDASGKALNTILRREEDKNAADHLHRVLQEFRAWKSKKNEEDGG